jgi:hypothetical protein
MREPSPKLHDAYKTALLSAITPKHIDEVVKMGEIMFAAGMFKDIRSAAQAVLKIMKGMEMGIPPVEAMTEIYFVKDRVTISANLMAKKIMQDTRYKYKVVELNNTKCVIDFFEIKPSLYPNEEVILGQSIFTMDDAILAGVASGENWKKWPRNMLFARALSNGKRWYCPDAGNMSGVYVHDEMGVAVNEEGDPMSNAIEELKESLAPPVRSRKLMIARASMSAFAESFQIEYIDKMMADKKKTDYEILADIKKIAKKKNFNISMEIEQEVQTDEDPASEPE